ncbi:MAG: hypothetical protein NZM44_06100 [Candidatus Calescibacterium sp.]|nr:hypothetical protein [Candidatus Calescibacterium sp.]
MKVESLLKTTNKENRQVLTPIKTGLTSSRVGQGEVRRKITLRI